MTPIEEIVGDERLHEFEDFLRGVIRSYRRTLAGDRRRLLERYRYVHAARKVVGVGSVGTRACIMLLLGRDSGDPLFLQFKEAEASVLEPFLGKSEFANHGQRVVEGQRLTQAASDIMLGWIRTDGRRRASSATSTSASSGTRKAPPSSTLMEPRLLRIYAGVCGAELARAHARSGDAIAISELPRQQRHVRPCDRAVRRVVRQPERARLRGADEGRRRRQHQGRNRRLGASGALTLRLPGARVQRS